MININLDEMIKKMALEKMGERFLKSMEDEAAETFLETLLLFMKFKFMLDASYKRNIENFDGRYQFRSKDGQITVFVEFKNGEMHIKEELNEDVNVTVIFKNGQSLVNFLLSENKDILRGLLHNEMRIIGNLNYIYKFAFMANHLQLELTGNLP